MMRRLTGLSLAATLAAAVAGCAQPVAPPPDPPPAMPDVVLITMDTTRADRIGAYGYEHAHTETIDALAAAGRRYDRAVSPIPLTIPAHAALLTGKYPPNLGIRDNGGARLPADAVTLAELLHQEGYASAASVAAFVTTRTWGFDQGFDAYFDDIPSDGRDFWHASLVGEQVVDRALEWVDGRRGDDGPLFLWVHLYDPHFPYTPPAPYLEQAEGRVYDGEIAYMDDQIARVVDAFAGRDALFVLSGDHGEALGDHKELTHGLYVYEATQRVPLILSGHGVKPEVVDAPTSLVDVVPTVLSILGLAAPAGLDGAVSPGAARPAYSESWQLATRFGIAPHLGVVDGSLKLIDTPRPELYDLASDPQELVNLAEGRPEEVERLRGVLASFGFKPPGAPAVADPEVSAQLQALGYVEGGFAGDLEGPLPDPKDHAALVHLTQRVDRQNLLGHPEEGLKALDTLVASYPEVVEFQTRRASLLGQLGRKEEAVAASRAALALAPADPQARMNLASSLAYAEQYDEAAELYRALVDELSYVPKIRVLTVSAVMASAAGVDAGVEEGLRLLEANPEDDALAGAIGVPLALRGETQRARPLLERGLRANPPGRSVAYAMALMTPIEDKAGIQGLLEAEVANYPGNAPAVAMLGDLYARDKAWEASVELFRSASAAQPEVLRWKHALAQSLFNVQRFAEARVALDRALQVAPEDVDLIVLDANLISKEGDPVRARARFDEAQRMSR